MSGYRVGDYVKIAAWTDTFMRGETHGTVEKVGTRYAHVRGNRSQQIFKFVNCDPYGPNPALTILERKVL